MKNQYQDMTYSQLLSARVALNNRIAEIEADAMEKLNRGEQLLNFRLKKGRKIRSIIDQGSLVQKLRDKGITNAEMYEAKFIGVPALEKLVNAKMTERDAAQIISDYVQITFGKSTLEYTGD